MERTIQGASVVDVKEKENSRYQMDEGSLMDSDISLNSEDSSDYNYDKSNSDETDTEYSNQVKTISLEEDQKDLDLKAENGQSDIEEDLDQQNQSAPESEGENQGGRKGFEFKISEPVTEINQEKLASIYDEHLVWLEALLNPNRKVFSGRANLSGADLAGFNLDGMNFSGASFKETSFRGASLIGTNFTGADMSGADFSGAKCSKTKFKRSILNRACFVGVDLSSCDLSYASQLGTQFEEKESVSTDTEEDTTQLDNIAEIEAEYFESEPEMIVVPESQPEVDHKSTKLS